MLVGSFVGSLDAAAGLVGEEAPHIPGSSPCHLTGELGETSGQDVHHVAGVIVLLFLFKRGKRVKKTQAREIPAIVVTDLETPLPTVLLVQ